MMPNTTGSSKDSMTLDPTVGRGEAGIAKQGLDPGVGGAKAGVGDLTDQNIRATEMAGNWTHSPPGLSTSSTQRPENTRIEEGGCRGSR